MSNLYERPLALVPSPQQLVLLGKPWRPGAGWRKFDFPRRHAWAFAANERAATRLLPRAPKLKEKRAESYAFHTFADGAVAVAHDAEGLAHARSTLTQLLQLAKDGAVPCVQIQDWPDLSIRGIHLDLKYM